MISEYDFGRVVISNKEYTSDVIIVGHEVYSSWWRKEGHSLCLDDLQTIKDRDIEVLVIGTGYSGFMQVLPEVKRFFDAKNVQVIACQTQEAVRKFNELVGTKKVAGAFHLTC
jgi:hypothetical protein